jgi:4-hydroxy-3-polyprenylbenzoate decarboxylase
MDEKRILLAMTGASGTPYGLRLAQILAERPDIELHLLISDHAVVVAKAECGKDLVALLPDNAVLHDVQDIGAGPASGSWRHHGMVVCPCSMSTLSGIVHGRADTLIFRAADVTLKERRPLILVPRETPLGRIHLQNMLQAHDAGALVLPPCPGFYHQPRDVQELVDQIVGRILDHLGLIHDVGPRWNGG